MWDSLHQHCWQPHFFACWLRTAPASVARVPQVRVRRMPGNSALSSVHPRWRNLLVAPCAPPVASFDPVSRQQRCCRHLGCQLHGHPSLRAVTASGRTASVAPLVWICWTVCPRLVETSLCNWLHRRSPAGHALEQGPVGQQGLDLSQASAARGCAPPKSLGEVLPPSSACPHPPGSVAGRLAHLQAPCLLDQHTCSRAWMLALKVACPVAP
mmetsp:Transcript_21604/g.50436  ORF Transcript_21604/g.50436 Transcript_21604/m.50436 type:complete len:212 (+) Transcript_21604:474-1109(+)